MKTGQQSDANRICRIEALHWVTGAGAHALGLGEEIGTIAPGRQADLTIIDGRALELWPNNDPIATVLRAGSTHVEAVLIAGRTVKRDKTSAFKGLDKLMNEARESSERLLAAADLPKAIIA